MTAFQCGVQNENINVINFAAPEHHAPILCNKGSPRILLLPQFIKEKILASTRSGPITVHTDANSRRVSTTALPYSNPLHYSTREADDNVQSHLGYANSDDSDDATLDEIVQFRATSSDSDEETRDPPPQAKPLGRFQQTIPCKPLNAKITIRLPTIHEVPSAYENSPVHHLSHVKMNDCTCQISIHFEEMCVKKYTNEEMVEVIAVDIPILGGKKTGVLLMHAWNA